MIYVNQSWHRSDIETENDVICFASSFGNLYKKNLEKPLVVWDVTHLLDWRRTLQCDAISRFATLLPNREWREICFFFAAKQQRLIRADDNSRDLVIFHNIGVQIWNRVVSQCHTAKNLLNLQVDIFFKCGCIKSFNHIQTIRIICPII